MKIAHLTTSFAVSCIIMFSAASLRAQETNKPHIATASAGSVAFGPKPNHVRLFLGGGDKSATGQQMARKLGITPYGTNQVLTLEGFTKIVVAALKREGREVAPDYEVEANIELSTGGLTILVYTRQKESCWVSFDSSGRITRVGGAMGLHGEGAWGREYRGGLPVGQAK